MMSQRRQPTPNAPIVDDEDRAASAQLYWMMLMICKGAALNTVFLAGDSEGLEAWQMRTRFAGQLMSILSYSFQGDIIERVTAWEREIATYERDSGKIIDDEIKVGAVAQIARITVENHLLMCVDKLKKWTDFRDEVAAISRAIAVAQSQPTPMDIGVVGKGKSGKGGKGSKGAGKRNNQTQQACSRCGNTDLTSANCPHSDKTCRKCGEVGHLTSVCVDLLEFLSPRPRVVRGAKEVAKVRMLSKLVGAVVRADTCRRSVPRRRSIRWKNPPLRVRLAAKTQSWLDRSGAISMMAAWVKWP